MGWKTKLSEDQIAALRADYEAWNPHDPDSPSADELARRHGITKQTMYTMKKRWEQADAAAKRREVSSSEDGLREAVVFLTQELARARARIEQLEAER